MQSDDAAVFDRITQPDCIEKGFVLVHYPRTVKSANKLKKYLGDSNYFFLHLAYNYTTNCFFCFVFHDKLDINAVILLR